VLILLLVLSLVQARRLMLFSLLSPHVLLLSSWSLLMLTLASAATLRLPPVPLLPRLLSMLLPYVQRVPLSRLFRRRL
jgi:hypothetical protein